LQYHCESCLSATAFAGQWPCAMSAPSPGCQSSRLEAGSQKLHVRKEHPDVGGGATLPIKRMQLHQLPPSASSRPQAELRRRSEGLMINQQRLLLESVNVPPSYFVQ
jgi:hypothetical protein